MNLKNGGPAEEMLTNRRTERVGRGASSERTALEQFPAVPVDARSYAIWDFGGNAVGLDEVIDR